MNIRKEKSMKKVWLSIAILVLSAMCSSTAVAQAPAAQVDHFRCYLVQGPMLNTQIQLQDQFDAALQVFENITQLTPFRFCNPVQKTVNGVTTPIVSIKHHLTIFLINPQLITMRQVVVNNQFGTQTLTVADARALAVPTGKAIAPNPAPPAPTDMDHYKCYVASGPAPNVLATLKDQFISETVGVLQAVAFCNPVKKIHNIVVTGIQFPAIHLVCYATTGSIFAGANINTSNQFGQFSYEVGRPDLLCVPSKKLSWSVVDSVPTQPTTP
jgi:hypothetical protein